MDGSQGEIILDYPPGPDVITNTFIRGTQEESEDGTVIRDPGQNKTLPCWLCRWRKGSQARCRLFCKLEKARKCVFPWGFQKEPDLLIS